MSKSCLAFALLALVMGVRPGPAGAAEPSSYKMLMLGEPVVDGPLPAVELLLALSQQEAAMQACFAGLPGSEGRVASRLLFGSLESNAAGPKLADNDGTGDTHALERARQG